MKKTLYSVVLATGLSILLIGTAANSQVQRVDCDKGHSLQAAIDKSASSADRHVVFVRGECEETITIARDRLVIDGKNEATIRGTVRIFGARTTLRDLSITGPGTGILASTARVRLLGVHADGNFGHGVTIVDDAVVFHGAGSESRGSLSNNGGAGAYVEASTYNADEVDINNNGGDGIWADNQSNVKLESVNVLENQQIGLSMNLHSVLDLSGNTKVAGNFQLQAYAGEDSAIRVSSPNIEVNGLIWCGDTESSYIDRAGAPNVDAPVCSGFNWWD